MQCTEVQEPRVAARLLLVDDDRLVLGTLAQGLRHMGYAVDTAECAEDAEAQLTGGQRPDLALVDVQMPGAGGLWLALRQRRDSLHRQRVISQLLDAADALEARLRAVRSEIEAIAGDHVNPVRSAMQDLLQQRLWLQDNAQRASLAQLEDVRRSLDSASASLDAQLQKIEQARAGQLP